MISGLGESEGFLPVFSWKGLLLWFSGGLPWWKWPCRVQEDSSCCAVAGPGLSQKPVARLYSSLEFMVSHDTYLVPGFASLSHSLSSYAGEWDSSMLPAMSFTCKETISPLPNALQAREPLLPVQPRESSDGAACSQGSTLLPQGALPGTTPVMALTSETLYFALCFIFKKK